MEHIKNILQEKTIILKGTDQATKNGFTQVPNFILANSKISPGAKLVFATLLSYAWHNNYCFPGQDKMAKDIGITRQSVNTHIKELEKKGFIQIKRRGLGKTNIYTLDFSVDKTGKK